MDFCLDGLSVEMVPAITKWSFEDLGDDPAKHRWRAWWAQGDVSNAVAGIELRAYPVIKPTPCGVWIDEWAYREWVYGENDPYQIWTSRIFKKRFVHDKSGQAWAKPTQDEAIESLAIRLCRWSSRIAADARRANSAADALAKLRPDLADFAEMARKNLKGTRP